MGKCDILVAYNELICSCCGSTIVAITNNSGLDEYSDADWLVYCCNPGCEKHDPDNLFQIMPDWVVRPIPF